MFQGIYQILKELSMELQEDKIINKKTLFYRELSKRENTSIRHVH
jgi:hypothetical protein